MRMGLVFAGLVLILAGVAFSAIDRSEPMPAAQTTQAQSTPHKPALLIGQERYASDRTRARAQSYARGPATSNNPSITAHLIAAQPTPLFRNANAWIAPWLAGEPQLDQASLLGAVSETGVVSAPIPAAGRYLFIFADSNHLPHSQVIEVKANASLALGTIRLRCGQTVTGTMLFGGVPEGWTRIRCGIPGTKVESDGHRLNVRWTNAGLQHGARYANTDREGNFSLHGVSPAALAMELDRTSGLVVGLLAPSLRRQTVDVPQASAFRWDLPVARVRFKLVTDYTHDWEPDIRAGPERVKIALCRDYGYTDVLLAAHEEVVVETSWATGHRTTESVSSTSIGSLAIVVVRPPPPTNQSVALRLTDARGHAMQSAWIEVRRAETPSSKYALQDWELDADDEGWVRLQHLIPDAYALTIHTSTSHEPLNGYEITRDLVIRLANGEHARRELLIEMGGKFELRITRNGRRVAGRVALRDSDDNVRVVRLRTQSHAKFGTSTRVQPDQFGAGYSVVSWAAIPADRYTLRVSIDDGKSWKSVEFTVQLGQTTPIDVQFD